MLTSFLLIGLAIQLGRIKVVKLLLKLGSDPNVANIFDGNHPLFLLAKSISHGPSKTTVLATLLLDAGSNPLLHVRYQADKNSRLHPSRTPTFNETPLLYCGD
jgi:ankyrin repeat protein